MSDKKKNRQDDASDDAEKQDAEKGSDDEGSQNNGGDKKSGNQNGGKDSGKDDNGKADDKNGSDGSGSDDADDSKDEDSDEDEDDVIKVPRTPTSPALLSRLQHSREYNQARGLGAGGTGAAIFHVQRLTALALIPLTVWFAVSMVRLSTATRLVALHWLAWPVNAAIMALFIVIALRHAVIGMQIIFEDYVHSEGLRAACVLVMKGVALVLGVAAVAALIHLSI